MLREVVLSLRVGQKEMELFHNSRIERKFDSLLFSLCYLIGIKTRRQHRAKMSSEVSGRIKRFFYLAAKEATSSEMKYVGLSILKSATHSGNSKKLDIDEMSQRFCINREHQVPPRGHHCARRTNHLQGIQSLSTDTTQYTTPPAQTHSLVHSRACTQRRVRRYVNARRDGSVARAGER